MEFAEVVRRRRMVRDYDPDRPVPPELVERLMEHAVRAPSAGFSQGWAFLVLTERADRDLFWSATAPTSAAPPGPADPAGPAAPAGPADPAYSAGPAGSAAQPAPGAAPGIPPGPGPVSGSHPGARPGSDPDPGPGPGSDPGLGFETEGSGPGSGVGGGGQSGWLAGMRRAPLLIVPMSSRRLYLDRYAEPDKGRVDRDESRWPVPYWHIDTGFAALLILLTAVDEGLGACFFGIPVSRVAAFRSAFGVPDDHEPIGAITVGYRVPDRRSPSLRRGRRPIEQVVHHGRWQSDDGSSMAGSRQTVTERSVGGGR